MRNRSGFTIIELLVVMAILGILVAILLPAVQAAREGARRAQCKDHLKQVTLAMHTYLESHRLFPISYGTGPYPFGDRDRGASWMQMILPHIEQEPLFSKIQFGKPLSDPLNTEVAQTAIQIFICPSDTHTGKMTFRSNVVGTWGVNNYKACAGSNWEWGVHAGNVSDHGRFSGNADGLDHGNGLICRGGQGAVPTRMADVRDGASNTFAAGEAVPEWSRHTWWWWFNATTATCAIPPNNHPFPDLMLVMEGNFPDNYSFQSRHTGGLHMAMVDGSVRFVSELISYRIWRETGTIDGREPVTEF